MKERETILASELVQRLQELIAESGDMPVKLMEPMRGAALPLSAADITLHNGQIEIWPAD